MFGFLTIMSFMPCPASSFSITPLVLPPGEVIGSSVWPRPAGPPESGLPGPAGVQSEEEL